MKCLTLAGGFGTRLYPLTISSAKALLDYKGKPLLTHVVDRIPKDIAISVSCNRKFEVDFCQWQKTLGREVEICIEDVWLEEQKKGAVSALTFWINRKNITEDLLVIAGDNYFEFNLANFIAAYDREHLLVAIHDIGDHNKASQFGVVKLDRNRIIELQEKPSQPESSLIATAIYIFPQRIFPLLSQYCAEGKRDNLGNLIAYLIDKDEVHGYSFTELWLDIGSDKSLP